MSTKTSSRTATTCTVAAFALGACYAFYFTLVNLGVLPDPPTGLVTTWIVVIIGLAYVPINMWIIDRRVNLAEQRHATELTRLQAHYEQTTAELQRIHSLLERFGDEALAAAHNAGKWEGFTIGVRDGGNDNSGKLRHLPNRSS